MIGGFLFLGGMKMDGVVRWFESVEVRECGRFEGKLKKFDPLLMSQGQAEWTTLGIFVPFI